jgi:hypothetical protein
MTDSDTQLAEMGLPSRSPFDYSGPSSCGLAPKEKTKNAQYQRARYWRDKERPTPTEKVLVKNAESSLGYGRRKAADKTNAIKNS